MNQYQKPQFDAKKFRPLIILGVAAVILAIFWGSITVKIQPGHSGIVFRQFGVGLDKETVYHEGFQFILPWNEMIIYETRQQQITENMQVRSSDLLDIGMDVTLFYEPIDEKIGYLHAKNGVNYADKIIAPTFRSVVRDIAAKYLPEEINTSKRLLVVEEIEKAMEITLKENYVQLNEIQIREIRLPALIQESIERKLQQQQVVEQYSFKITTEQKEADRKRIEAEGIAAFQRIITQSINDQLLRWKGIEATLELAKSTNAKVVVVGSGKDGLPLILGQ